MINTLFILIHFMIICFITKTICKRPTPNAEFTRRLYSVHTARSQRAHGALEDPTALPQRCHSVLSNTLWKRQAAAFVLSMLKVNAATWRSRRLHSVSTAFPQRCWRLHSAHLGVLQFFKRYGNAVRTPLWCDRDLILL